MTLGFFQKLAAGCITIGQKLIPLKAAKFSIFIMLLLALCPVARGSQSLVLGWNPDTDPGTVGYVLYYGNASGSYSSRVDVGTNTTATLSTLKEGQTNYFVITGYNVAGVEGPRSTEIVYNVPGILLASPKPTPGSPMNLKFSAAPGHWYEVQATTDLKTWSTVLQTTVAASNGWINYQDSQTNALGRRFYRLILH